VNPGFFIQKIICTLLFSPRKTICILLFSSKNPFVPYFFCPTQYIHIYIHIYSVQGIVQGIIYRRFVRLPPLLPAPSICTYMYMHMRRDMPGLREPMVLSALKYSGLPAHCRQRNRPTPRAWQRHMPPNPFFFFCFVIRRTHFFVLFCRSDWLLSL
jgi:hypothetical protein